MRAQMQAVRDRFVEVLKEHGLTELSGRDRGMILNQCLGRDRESKAPISLSDYSFAIENAPAIIQSLTQGYPAATPAASAPPAAAPLSPEILAADAQFEELGLEDPFATEPARN
jgi:hypothetical protein